MKLWRHLFLWFYFKGTTQLYFASLLEMQVPIVADASQPSARTFVLSICHIPCSIMEIRDSGKTIIFGNYSSLAGR